MPVQSLNSILFYKSWRLDTLFWICNQILCYDRLVSLSTKRSGFHFYWSKLFIGEWWYICVLYYIFWQELWRDGILLNLNGLLYRENVTGWQIALTEMVLTLNWGSPGIKRTKYTLLHRNLSYIHFHCMSFTWFVFGTFHFAYISGDKSCLCIGPSKTS